MAFDPIFLENLVDLSGTSGGGEIVLTEVYDDLETVDTVLRLLIPSLPVTVSFQRLMRVLERLRISTLSREEDFLVGFGLVHSIGAS